MSDLISKKDVRDGINIIKSGLAMAGVMKAFEALAGGDTPEAHEALGAAGAFSEGVKGIDAFLEDLEAFPTV